MYKFFRSINRKRRVMLSVSFSDGTALRRAGSAESLLSATNFSHSHDSRDNRCMYDPPTWLHSLRCFSHHFSLPFLMWLCRSEVFVWYNRKGLFTPRVSVAARVATNDNANVKNHMDPRPIPSGTLTFGASTA